MPRKNKKRNEVGPAEDFRISLDVIFKDFLEDPELEEYTFPNDLNNVQRKYIHEKSRILGLKSKSTGKEPNRMLTITKKPKANAQLHCSLSLDPVKSQILNELVLRCPNIDVKGGLSINAPDHSSYISRFSYGRPITVKRARESPLSRFRRTLPVTSIRDEVYHMLDIYQVLVISAETGSGKTTQIPQFILEQATDLNRPCRIICTQPRRLSTIAVSERVAAERGEILGDTVGYQIKLESRMGPNTSLIYCTNGVLLRTLMSCAGNFSEITHIIIDEIHERDRFSDFLLICLKQQLRKNPNLKVILMSASMDVQLFLNYFPGSQKLTISGRLYPIKQVFLDEILPMINYESNAMKQVKKQRLMDQAMENKNQFVFPVEPVEVVPEMSEAILECVTSGTEEDFMQVMHLIMAEGNSVNYQEQSNGYTVAIAAAMKGNLQIMEQLINLGADINISSNDGMSPLGWAKEYSRFHVVNFLEAYLESKGLQCQIDEPSNLLLDYDGTVPEENIDFDLIKEIVIYIHNKLDKEGGILVFLPGYDDILNCYEYISTCELHKEAYEIFMLHGSMQMGAQHKVFNKLRNKQKIILSTNVAETSITIDDVSFVIDCGRAKEKSYDAFTGTHSLEKTWISKACVKQRAGRAGRTKPGYSFHIFSKARYESMQLSTTPEILRVPLQELCLHTKMLAPSDMEIAHFLSLALQPPSTMAVQKAIQSLKLLGALDEEENVTILGKHLLQLSVEPHLGKMLIYSIIFKCLDPILTIVACLNQKDPFILPGSMAQRGVASNKKKELTFGTYSDHMSLLKAFQLWQEAKLHNKEYRFCQENFISSSTMDTIMQTRNQLLSQLRAEGFISVANRDAIQEVNVYSDSWPLVKATISSGLYPHIAYIENGRLATRTDKKIVCHFSSCLHKQLLCEPVAMNWLMFEELAKTGSFSSIKCATVITPFSVGLICGEVSDYNPGQKSMSLDEWIEFEVSDSNYFYLRRAVERIVIERIKNPKNHLYEEPYILAALKNFLNHAETTCGLPTPSGIGAKPSFFHSRPNFTDNRHQNVYKRRHNQSNSRNNDQQDYTNRYKPPARHKYPEQAAQPNTSKVNINYQEIKKGIPDSSYVYILIKERVLANMDMALNQNIWLFTKDTENKVRRLLRDNNTIILIFSGKGTGVFQGVAKVVELRNNCQAIITWMSKRIKFYSDVKLKVNARIHLYADGQEIEPHIGRDLYNVLTE